jgi:uncharacterized secreted protein with C-terminal beta-propeller domain
MGTLAHTRRAAAVALAAGLAITGCSATTGTRAAPAALAAYHDCASLLNGLRAATTAQPDQLQNPHGPVRLPYADSADTPPQSHSTTNVQEAGVDEPDTVKTDGRRIVTVAQGELRVIDAATRKVTGTIGIGGGWSTGDVLMSGDRVLIVTQPVMTFVRPQGDLPGAPGSGPRFTLVDIFGAPRIVSTMTVRGSYVDARQVGSVARIVVRSSPHIMAPMRAPLSDWLTSYTVTSGGRSQTRSVPCGQVSHPSAITGGSMVTILTVDLAGAMADLAPVSVVAGADTVYGTARDLYIAGQIETPPQPRSPTTPTASSAGTRTGSAVSAAPSDRTNIYEFGLSGSRPPKFEAAGAVTGTLLSQYSMSEYNGDLRVAAASGTQTSVDVLARRGDRLVQVGGVGGLGKGEQVYAVRFAGPTGYVVTYRQVDPLYTLDLSEPAKPRLTGELTISGYSAYLHPTADGRLIGVGQDVSNGRPTGTRVSLFDVHDPAHPVRVAGYQVGTGASAVEFDPHAFLYWPATGLTVLPVSDETLVLSISSNGIRKIGTIRPPTGTLAAQRSILIGTTLWTVSTAGAQANDATTLARTAWLPF